MTRDEMIETLTSVQASCHACRWRDEVAALASVIAALRAPAVTEGVKNAKEEVANIEAHIRALLPESYLESIGANVQAPNHKRELHHRCMRIFADLADRLRAPAVTGEAHQTGPQPTACGGAAAMPISGPERPGDSVKYPLDERGTPEDVTAGETALYAAPPAAGAPPAEGSPLPLEHTRSCGALTGRECTCGLAWRIRLATEQEMHAAWRKRAEEAETRENAGAPPALVALVQEWQEARRDWDETIWIEPANVNQRGERLQAAVRALLAWSPAPAPAAPPAETPVPEDGCTVQFEDMKPWPAPPADAVARVRAIAKESARLLDMPEPSPARAGYPYTGAGDAVMAQRFPHTAPPAEIRCGDQCLDPYGQDDHCRCAPPAVAGVDWASGPDRSVALHAPVAPPAETRTCHGCGYSLVRCYDCKRGGALACCPDCDHSERSTEPAPPAETHYIVGRVDHGDDEVTTACGVTLSTWDAPVKNGVATFDRDRVTCAACQSSAPPEIQVGDVVIEDDEWRRARHIQTEDQSRFWSSPTKLGPNALVVMGERHGQPFIWRRRQEGQ